MKRCLEILVPVLVVIVVAILAWFVSGSLVQPTKQKEPVRTVTLTISNASSANIVVYFPSAASERQTLFLTNVYATNREFVSVNGFIMSVDEYREYTKLNHPEKQ